MSTISSAVELNALHYKDNCKSQYSQAHGILQGIEIEENFSILDVGCGHGKIIGELSQLAPKGRNVGIDPSANMIKLAAETFSEMQYPNLEFHQMKAEDMDFQSKSFDLIVCTNTFMWIRNPTKALKLMFDFLKPGGKLVIFTYDKETSYVKLFEEILYKSYSEYAHTSAVNTMLSVQEHKDLLLNTGFSIDQFEIKDITFSYKNKKAFRDYILGWLSCYIQIPMDQQDRFIDEVVEASDKFNISTNEDEITIPHRTISIKVHKE